MSDFNAFLTPATLWVPDHLPASSFIEHAPLAFWLADALRPRSVVQIGVGDGFAYLCFCQAVDRLRLDARVIGIDPFTGADIAFREITALNRRYEAFSSPVRGSEAIARRDMPPGSVDLLHIDLADGGAMATAFDDWRPLLSDDAVVLLHGVNARPEGDAARRFFDELRSRYPAFLAPAGDGLGLVVPGGAVPPTLRPLLKDSPRMQDRVAKLFGTLGDTVRMRRQALASHEALGLLLQDRAAEPVPLLPTDADPEIGRLGAKLAAEAVRNAEHNADLRRQAALSADWQDELARLRERLSKLDGGDAGSPGRPRKVTRASSPTGPVAGGPTQAEFDQLQAALRDARAGEAAARRASRAAQRAIRSRHGELKRQAEELEAAAAAARADVLQLATAVTAFLDEEHAARVAREVAQQHLEALLRHEQAMLQPRQDLRHVLTLGAARRWQRQAKTYAALVARIGEATADIRAAQARYDTAKAASRHAEQLAIAAEPRASELASAAVVLRAEVAAADSVLATLPKESGDDAALYSDDYSRWVDFHDTLSDTDRRAIRARLTRLPYRPLISVVMPVYNTPREFLRQAVASVQAQLYPHWELCIADDASPEPEVFALLQELAAADERIKIMRRESNGHISAASNSALALASGEFVALMDHDDVLAEHALFEVVAALNDDRDLDLIYSDEDHIDQHGRRNNAYFKSDFNLDLLLGQNTISHLGVYRRNIIDEVGGFRLGFEGSQDYDLALRVVDATVPARIHHIPAVLYHWRSNTGEATFSEAFIQRCLDAARRALKDHLARRGHAGEVLAHPEVPTWSRVKRAVPEPAPLVSIIVPTKDKPEILGPCIEGLLHRTDYQHLQIIVVDHQSTDPDALDLLGRLAREPRVEIMPYEGPFNYSAINNAAVKRARGPLLALLNNDVDVINPDWLDEMVALAVLPEVGAVGAKLFYPDDRVQHAGVLLGAGGVAGHYFHLFDANDPGYFGRAVMTSSVSAVTAACLVVRRSVFDEVGGFDAANLPVAFNDVDLCLKIGEAGYRNVWTPHAQLYHHESLSRGSDEVGERHERFKREVEFMMQKWDGLLAADPSYNPNLSLPGCAFALSFPPRRRKPWKHEGS